jgi:hypothetical protein
MCYQTVQSDGPGFGPKAGRIGGEVARPKPGRPREALLLVAAGQSMI